jgi:hypothetical protein
MEEVKICPFCGEKILVTAQKCKHCGEWFEKKVTWFEKKVTWWKKNIRFQDEITTNGMPKISKFCKWWYIINSLSVMLHVLMVYVKNRHILSSGPSIINILMIAIPAILTLFTLVYAIRLKTKTRLFALVFSIYAVILVYYGWIFGIPFLIFSLISMKVNKSNKRLTNQ